MPRPRVSPWVLLVFTNLFWAGNFVVGRAVHEAMPPAGLAFWRWAVALLILAPFAIGPVRREWSLVRLEWRPLAVMGLLSVGLFSMLLYTGLTTTTATNALLLNSTAPVLIVLVGWFVTGDRVTPMQAGGIALSLIGVAAIVFRGNWEGVRTLQFGVGDLWVMAAVVVWATYTALLRRRPPRVSMLTFLAVTIVAGALVTLPPYLIASARGATTTFTAGSLAAVLYMGVFPSLLSHAFWNDSVRRVGPTAAGLFIHLTPVFGTTLAILFLGETLRGYHLVGIALILAGIVVTTRRSPTRAAG